MVEELSKNALEALYRELTLRVNYVDSEDELRQILERMEKIDFLLKIVS